jgi:hypothetical protein
MQSHIWKLFKKPVICLADWSRSCHPRFQVSEGVVAWPGSIRYTLRLVDRPKNCVSQCRKPLTKPQAHQGRPGNSEKLTSRHFDARCKGGDLTPRQRLNMFTGRKEIPLKARCVGLLTEHDWTICMILWQLGYGHPNDHVTTASQNMHSRIGYRCCWMPSRAVSLEDKSPSWVGLKIG